MPEMEVDASDGQRLSDGAQSAGNTADVHEVTEGEERVERMHTSGSSDCQDAAGGREAAGEVAGGSRLVAFEG